MFRSLSKFSRYYLPAIGLTFMGNGIHYISMIWLIYSLTQSVVSVSILLGISFTFRALGSYFSHQFVDHFGMVPVAVGSDIVRFIVLVFFILTMPLLAGLYLVLSILLLEMMLSISTPLFSVSTAGLIKIHIDSNSMLGVFRAKELIMQIGLVLGTAISGYIMSYTDIKVALLINAFTYLISAALISKISKIKILQSDSLKANQVVREKNRITNILVSNKYILPLIILSLFIAFPVLVFDNVLADYVNKYLMGNERLFGLIESSYAVGALLAIFGASAVSYITSKTNHSYILIIFLGITYCSFGYISNTTAIIILALFAGLLGVSLKVIIQAKIQTLRAMDSRRRW